MALQRLLSVFISDLVLDMRSPDESTASPRTSDRGQPRRIVFRVEPTRLTSDLRVDDVHARVAHMELGPSIAEFVCLWQTRAFVLRPPRDLLRYRAEVTGIEQVRTKHGPR